MSSTVGGNAPSGDVAGTVQEAADRERLAFVEQFASGTVEVAALRKGEGLVVFGAERVRDVGKADGIVERNGHGCDLPHRGIGQQAGGVLRTATAV